LSRPFRLRSGQLCRGRVLAVAWLLLVAGRAALACEVTQAAVVPIDTTTPNMIVRVEVNGSPEPFILDTGAQRTILDVDMVTRLQIARDRWVATTMRGVGGDDRELNAQPSSMVLGGVRLQLRTVAAVMSLPVGHLPPAAVSGRQVAGLLGADLLGGHDLMLNGPQATLALYSVRDCAGRFLPWAGPYSAIPTIRPVGDVLLVPARIDGKVLLAEIDSGASFTTILAPGLEKLGLSQAMLNRDPAATVRGVGPQSVTVRFHRFGSMTIGDDRTPNPVLGIGPARSLRIVDMLLGADWLKGRVVWLSYATTQVFVAGP